MARKQKTTVEEIGPKTERKRTFTESSVVFELWGIDKSTDEPEKKAEAKTAPAALAQLQLAEAFGGKTHRDFYIRKVAILTLNNGEVVE